VLKTATTIDSYRHKERVDEFNGIHAEYDTDRSQFDDLKKLVVDMLASAARSNDFGDHLGNIYMEIVPPSKAQGTGQFFTPYHVSELLAQINLGDVSPDGKVISINDPCCGAGGMLVACCDVLHQKKINYTQQALFVANDIDKMCVDMTYLQLAFLGASAVVEHMNTITQECWDVYVTLGFVLVPGMPEKFKSIKGEKVPC
jgi:hypothetical protein